QGGELAGQLEQQDRVQRPTALQAQVDVAVRLLLRGGEGAEAINGDQPRQARLQPWCQPGQQCRGLGWRVLHGHGSVKYASSWRARKRLSSLSQVYDRFMADSSGIGHDACEIQWSFAIPTGARSAQKPCHSDWSAERVVEESRCRWLMGRDFSISVAGSLQSK